MNKILFLLVLFSGKSLFSQPIRPIDYELKHFTIKDKDLGLISFYIDTVQLKHKSPLFIDVNGSGGLPLCLYVKASDQSSVMNTFHAAEINRTKEKFHFIILDKPGIPFCDSITVHQPMKTIEPTSLMESYQPSDEYTRRLSLQWRTRATKKVMDWLIRSGYWDQTKIIAYGYSEGGQVVPCIAAEHTHLYDCWYGR